MVGLIVSKATAETQARELSHQFRFIIPRDQDGKASDVNHYTCGDLCFRIWQTDFAFHVAERGSNAALRRAGV